MRYDTGPCLRCGRPTRHIPGGHVHTDNNQVHCARSHATEATPDPKGRRTPRVGDHTTGCIQVGHTYDGGAGHTITDSCLLINDEGRCVTPAPPAYQCDHCGVTANTDDLTVIGRNCAASDFNNPHTMAEVSA